MPAAHDSAFDLPRVVIQRISPELDGGRHPVKRVVGREVAVGVDILKDGHDVVAARLCHRVKGERKWATTPLEFVFDDERWMGRFTPERVGRHQFRVEAWPDPFATWCGELKKRIDAGQDVKSELLEGAAIVRARLAHAAGASTVRLADAHRTLAHDEESLEARIEVALSPQLLELMAGPWDETTVTRSELREIVVDPELAEFSTWYELFPRSQTDDPARHGTFADVEARLPQLAALGFDVLYLPPIHPIGQSKRKGRNNSPSCQPGDVGSPWAIGSAEGGHDAVHPQLGSLADFEKLVRSARALGIEVALDFALQCSPDHPWVKRHPEWFFVRPDGTLRYAENPPKKYEDIYPLNFWCTDRAGLWTACRDLLLFWIARGVTIFRVDNPHTKPFAFWEWCIAEVKARHPEVILLAEAFTRPKRMQALAKLGFTQSYTYFTWKNTSEELRAYVSELAHGEMAEYYRPNFFANTPDILHEYLQRGGPAAFRVRLVLAATLSPTYGIYSGYEQCENVPLREGSEEYLHSEKYEIKPRLREPAGVLEPEIARLNRIRREHPALQRLDNVTFLYTEYPGILAYLKRAQQGDLIVTVNTDPHSAHDTLVDVPLELLGIGETEPFAVRDLLTGERYVWQGRHAYVRLDPRERVAHVLRVERA